MRGTNYLNLLFHNVPGVDLLPYEGTLEEHTLGGQLSWTLLHFRLVVTVHLQ